MASDNNIPKTFTKKEMTLDDRRNLFFTCINTIKDNKFYKGFWSEVSSNLPVSATCASGHWKKLRQKYEDEFGPISQMNKITMMTTTPDSFFATNKAKTGQNARQYYPEAVSEALKMAPRIERQTAVSSAQAIGIPKSTFHRHIKQEGAGKRHTNSVKPILTEFNKYRRIIHALDHIDPGTINLRTMKYADDHLEMDVDEKWFHLTEVNMSVYLGHGEEAPVRRCEHKSYIDKIMFLSAVARPRTMPDGTFFDGKLGMFPIGEYQPAKRDSINRPKGTMEWKNISVDCDSYRHWMVNEILPAIMSRWPESEWNDKRVKIRIQQDGAGGHMNVEGKAAPGASDRFDLEWHQVLEELELQDKIYLVDQPSNSPDSNINDLGSFNALEKSYNKLPISKRGHDDIIKCAVDAYWSYPAYKINRMWLTRQTVFNEIFKCGGDNTFDIPHIGKGKMEREGTLPRVLEVCEEAKQYLWMMDYSSAERSDLMQICTPKPELKRAEPAAAGAAAGNVEDVEDLGGDIGGVDVEDNLL